MSVGPETKQILDGEIPEQGEIHSDEKGRLVVKYGGKFLKSVEGQRARDLKQIKQDLGDSVRTPETQSEYDKEKMYLEQRPVETDVFDAVESYGLEYVVDEVTGIFDDFIDEGYVPKELSPKDIRFDEDGTGVLIDYLDKKSVGTLEDTIVEPASKNAFRLFADHTSKNLSENNEGFEYEETYTDILNMVAESSSYIEGFGSHVSHIEELYFSNK